MLKSLRHATALTGATVLLAVPTALAVAAPAHADIERHGSCGGGFHEFNVDREDGGFEVNADLESVRPGTRWRVVLKHDGNRYHRSVHTADREGEVDVERFRRNTAGGDVFTMKIRQIGQPVRCTARIATR